MAPSRRVGNEWLETLARTGRPTANLHVTTMSALAYDIVSATLARDAVGLEIVAVLPAARAPRVALAVAVALPKGDRQKWLAVLLPPIPPLVVAFFVYFRRRAQEREGVAKTRLR